MCKMRSKTYAKKRWMNLDELRGEAASLGADAVVGIALTYNEIGATGSTMLMLVAPGTAVTVQEAEAISS